ncbi:hypothetical protein E1212_02120 [Jiangella ureilytica]|uniref:Uncharacterized protein n=1 Tax=Jiangella ureilytica TaxID=2530374 RepID=A0A4R4RWJ5_9ACTN|nr:hypothetical protein [Jiangella ureilytica]TDC54571.1 hypothetical protein E1212_02120 [Jiangella ureilytica]
MAKAADSLAPEPGKTGAAGVEKMAGGGLDKEFVPDDTAAVDYSAYADAYEPPADGGGGYSGGGGAGGGSADDTADAPAEPDADADTGDDPLYAESDGDPGAPTEVTDDFGDPELPTKPGLPDAGAPEQIPDPQPPTPPPSTVSIDVEAMTRLVAAMERAGEQIVALQDEMRTILSGVHLETSETARFQQVADWISEELPGLRRRLAMAQDLLGGGGVSTQPDHRPQVPRPYVGDESQITARPPRESYDAGRVTAQRFGLGDHETTTLLVAELRENRHDPYYAREVAHTADPETMVRAVVAAGDGEQAAELTELTAATVATASRGTGELAPPAGYEEQWAALRESDDPAVAAAAEQLRPA